MKKLIILFMDTLYWEPLKYSSYSTFSTPILFITYNDDVIARGVISKTHVTWNFSHEIREKVLTYLSIDKYELDNYITIWLEYKLTKDKVSKSIREMQKNP